MFLTGHNFCGALCFLCPIGDQCISHSFRDALYGEENVICCRAYFRSLPFYRVTYEERKWKGPTIASIANWTRGRLACMLMYCQISWLFGMSCFSDVLIYGQWTTPVTFATGFFDVRTQTRVELWMWQCLRNLSRRIALDILSYLQFHLGTCMGHCSYSVCRFFYWYLLPKKCLTSKGVD